MDKNKQNLIWGGIGLVALAFFLYSGKLSLPSQQSQSTQSPQHQTPGAIKW